MNTYERICLLLMENETVEESFKKKLAGLAIAGALAAGGVRAYHKAKAPKADPLRGRSALEVLDAGNKSTQKMLDQQRKNQAAKESERKLLRHLKRNER